MRIRRPKTIDFTQWHKIVVIQNNQLGDAVISTGILKAIREAFPEAWIAYMCDPVVADLMSVDFVNDVISYTKGMAMRPTVQRI